MIDIRCSRPIGELFPIRIVARLSIAFLVVGRIYLRMDKLSLAWDLMSFSLSSDKFCWVAIRAHRYLASCVNPEEVLIPVAKPRQSAILLGIYLGIEALLFVI